LPALCTFLSQAASAAPLDVLVPAKTLVQTHLAQPINSASAHQGDSFGFVVAQNVIVDNLIVIPARAAGSGHITEAHSAGKNGHSGGLQLSFDFVYAADGSVIPVSHDQQAAEKDRSTLGTYPLAFIPFVGGILRGLAAGAIRGKEVTIPADLKIYVSTSIARKVRVDSVKAAAPSPAPSSPASPLPSPTPARTSR
jgi:hypothetical protein